MIIMKLKKQKYVLTNFQHITLILTGKIENVSEIESLSLHIEL